MKKYTFLTCIFLLAATCQLFAQKLAENKKDEFTNNLIKRTSWESLSSTFSINAHFRISLIDSLETFDLKVMIDKRFSIDKDQELMFKLENGEVVKLQNLEAVRTCQGCGAVGLKGSEAPGIAALYPLNKDQAEKLKTNKVVKVRIYTTEGYLECDVKDKFAQKINAALGLL